MSARARRTVEVMLALVLAVLWATTLRPASLGGPATYVVIRGDSMEPAYHSGDLVLLRSAATYAAGDVVGYRVPAGEVGAGSLVVHRIVAVDGQAGFVMLGDGNPAPDPWTPLARDVVGRAWLYLPAVGSVISFLQQPAATGALAVSLLVMIGLARRRANGGTAPPFVPPPAVPAGT